MKDLKIFEGKVVCPRCYPGGGGFIYKAKICNIDQIFFICDECDALWEKSESIIKDLVYNESFHDLSTFIKEKYNIEYPNFDWEYTDYTWHQDKNNL